MPSTSSSENKTGRWPAIALQIAIILLAGFWVFSPALHGNWLWDDDRYFTANPLLNDPARLWKLWFASGSLDEYYPVLGTIQWFQWRLWGTDTFGYHFTNILFHLLCALLLWRLFHQLGLRFAWLGGLIFAVHPMTVESVAWIAELKNTHSLLPLLIAACFYLDYDDCRSDNPQRALRCYRAALVFFLIALLCKISVAPFPLALLLHAWWKRNRLDGHDLRAALPFFILSLILGLLAIWVAHRYYQLHPQPPVIATPASPLGQIAFAGVAAAFFLSHAVWPVALLPIYSPWPIDPLTITQLIPGLILLIVLASCWIWRKSWGRHVLFGLGFFLIFLAPDVCLLLAKYPALVWSLDHLGYIALIGIIGLAVAGLQKLADSLPLLRPLLYVIATAVVISLAFESRGYASLFVDQKTLWIYTLEHNPDARQGLGTRGAENPRH
ncbi:MAG: hypothetical protein LV479_10860 [Methylacidiphilales bacterium]|nr:hypothetical protein [Candidatus Methylacidiphilales bacterium]